MRKITDVWATDMGDSFSLHKKLMRKFRIFPEYNALTLKIDEEILTFISEEEVDEFCELLQEKKKEIWQ